LGKLQVAPIKGEALVTFASAKHANLFLQNSKTTVSNVLLLMNRTCFVGDSQQLNLKKVQFILNLGQNLQKFILIIYSFGKI
jgi:hypothetical protein